MPSRAWYYVTGKWKWKNENLSSDGSKLNNNRTVYLVRWIFVAYRFLDRLTSPPLGADFSIDSKLRLRIAFVFLFRIILIGWKYSIESIIKMRCNRSVFGWSNFSFTRRCWWETADTVRLRFFFLSSGLNNLVASQNSLISILWAIWHVWYREDRFACPMAHGIDIYIYRQAHADAIINCVNQFTCHLNKSVCLFLQTAISFSNYRWLYVLDSALTHPIDIDIVV